MKKERFITIEIYEMQTGNWNSDSESEYYFEKENAIGNAEYHVYPHLTDAERKRKGEFCIVTGYKVRIPLSYNLSGKTAQDVMDDLFAEDLQSPDFGVNYGLDEAPQIYCEEFLNNPCR